MARLIPAGVALAGLALAAAIAVGAIPVPDLSEVLTEATRSLGGWIYLVVGGLIFLETTALAGFLVHGELVLLVGGVAAERGDAWLVAVIAIAATAAVAGDAVSFLMGRRLGRPFLERHRIGAAHLAAVDGFFARHGGKAVILGRFTGFLRATLPFVAGGSGMALRRLLPFSAGSAIAWTALFCVIGYAVSGSVTAAGETATRISLVAVLLIAAAYVIRERIGTPRPQAP